MFFVKKYRYEIILLIIIAVVAGLSYLVGTNAELFTDEEALKRYLRSVGPLAPFVIIILTALETVIAPLPGGILPVVSGLLFGLPQGIIYPVAGNIIGASLAFWIGRRLGKTVVMRLVSQRELERFTSMIHKRQGIFWSFYFLPIFPVDVLTFAISLSEIPYRKFLIISAIGLTVNMTLYVTLGHVIGRLVLA